MLDISECDGAARVGADAAAAQRGCVGAASCVKSHFPRRGSAAYACSGWAPEDSRSGRALVSAVRDNDLAAVTRLLDEGTSPDAGFATGYTALGLACNRGHNAVAELLLQRGATADLPICSDGATPLVISIVWNNQVAVELLLRHCALIDAPSSRRAAGPYKGASPTCRIRICMSCMGAFGASVLAYSTPD